MSTELTTEHFRRADEGDDAVFYSEPRLVKHIDEFACAALASYFQLTLPEDGNLLDLMSSWASHLPETPRYRRVTGLGMNQTELNENPQLTDRIVHNLAIDPKLPFEDASFDGCMITVSVQYLIHPITVFEEVARVLKPQSPCIVSFSNRCFPTKAVEIWQQLTSSGHAKLVGYYFDSTRLYGPHKFQDISPNSGRTDPLFVVCANSRYSRDQ